MSRALQQNLDLAQAVARVAQARAGLGAADAALLPTGVVSGQAARAYQSTQTPLGQVLSSTPGFDRHGSAYEANLGASWELDLFGKNRAALDASIGQSRAAQADAQAARMLLASNVARSYFQWLRVQGQLEVAQRTLAQRQQTQQLVKDRLQAGLDTQLELQQSESGLPDARFQIEALKEQEALLLNALAALTGQQNTPLALTKYAPAAINQIANTSAAGWPASLRSLPWIGALPWPAAAAIAAGP